jgi:CheY-like chemotaxis protein
MVDDNILNVLLIGENIETRIVFKNALSKMGRLCNVDDYYCSERAIGHSGVSRMKKTDIIFLDTKDNSLDFGNEVRKIRDCEKFSDCSLVVFDSNSHLKDAKNVFAEGADVFINQPYDFPRLKKVIGNIMSINWEVNRFSGNKQHYFL